MIDASKYGPWAVIAGGSEGVGSEFALQLADAGINSVLIARKPGPLEETAETVRAKGVEVRTLALDLTQAEARQTIIEQTQDLDVGLFIYNAGANTYGHDFITGDLTRFREVVDLNITAQLELTQHFGKVLADRGRGGMILVGSMAGFSGSAQISVYAAAKAFARIFAEGLWVELREKNVDVLDLILGVTRTPAMARAGLNMDIPGMHVSEPADVARQGLENLGKTPTKIAEGNEKGVEARQGPNREQILLAAHEASKKLLPPQSE
ncbi:SDR family NAD(P)-dependent oxidoreductase [Enemella sp. A6]|uniref:SDR family NAD(P)-dependent oxidoreductase n=1 Tax=Enemella sp. A6 TaxID=3440152 RepID=UPI003EBC4902